MGTEVGTVVGTEVGTGWGLSGDCMGANLDHSAKVRVDIGDSGQARPRMPGAWDAGV